MKNKFGNNDVFFYQFFNISTIISPIVIFLRILRKKKMFQVLEKFSSPTCKRKRGKLLWFHGASVGEILSAL